MVCSMLSADNAYEQSAREAFWTNLQCQGAIACRHEAGRNECTQHERHRKKACEPPALTL